MRRLLACLLTFWSMTAHLTAENQAPNAPAFTPKNPVLLVHGIKDDARRMESLARSLRRAGWEAHTMSYRPSWGQKGLDLLAEQVRTFVEENFAPGQKIDLVAFSMGGLVSRYYLQRLGGAERVQRFVTISTPHHGTLMAWLIPNPGCRQMRIGSAFLADLNRNSEELRHLQFTSFWTPFDLVIIPPRSSEMPQAENICLPVLAHPLMVFQRSCQRAVAAALSRPKADR